VKNLGGLIEKLDTYQIFGLRMVFLQSYDKNGTRWTVAIVRVMEWIKDGHRKWGRLEICIALCIHYFLLISSRVKIFVFIYPVVVLMVMDRGILNIFDSQSTGVWQYCLYLQEMCFKYYPNMHAQSHTHRKCVMVCGIALSNSVMKVNFCKDSKIRQ